MTIDVRLALFPADEAAVLTIWREYIRTTKSNLAYQNNEADFAVMAEKYVPPHGCVVLAHAGNAVIGCIAFRRHDQLICEMKRLYVRPEGRGRGVGRRLVEHAIGLAQDLGFADIRLDVLSEFEHAQRLYATFGFRNAAPISVNPIKGTQFLGLKL